MSRAVALIKSASEQALLPEHKTRDDFELT